MVYHSVPVELSKQHINKLAQGVSIKLSNENLTGDHHVIHLTTAQAKRYIKALENNKGMTLKFSATQLRHNMKQEGGGIWDFVKDAVLPVAKDVGKNLLKQGVDKGLSYVGNQLQSKISGLGVLNQAGKGFRNQTGGLLGGNKGKFKILPVAIPANDDRVVVAPNQLDMLVHQPMSVMNKKPTAELQGGNIFDSIADFAGSTITGARDVALAGLYKRIAGNGVKKTGRKKIQGGSFTLPSR